MKVTPRVLRPSKTSISVPRVIVRRSRPQRNFPVAGVLVTVCRCCTRGTDSAELWSLPGATASAAGAVATRTTAVAIAAVLVRVLEDMGTSWCGGPV